MRQSQILCFYDTTTFVSDCVQDGTATAAQRDSFVNTACDAVSTGVCDYTTGSCDAGLSCAVIEPTVALCANSDATAPAGATDCSANGNPCTGTQVCGPSGQDQVCYNSCAPPACSGGLQCTLVNTSATSFNYVCLTAAAAVPNSATICDDGPADCAITQGCLKFTGSAHSYCVEFCFLNDGTYVSP